MDLVGAKGTSVTAVALNDYVSTIPVEDFKKFNVILAIKLDGNYMTVRERVRCLSSIPMIATRNCRSRPIIRGPHGKLPN